MRILALDIGAGTVDVLLFDDRHDSIENCVKMVLPSPSKIIGAKIQEITKQKKALFIHGEIIGGHTLTAAIKKHLANGLRVVMTEQAAYSVRNNLDEVRALGIEISLQASLEQFEGEILRISEINLLELEAFLNNFNETILDVDILAIAVQDHGVSPSRMSNRRFRIQQMKTQLTGNPRPENLAFWSHEVPPQFLRMKSAVEVAKRQVSGLQVLVMDTASAAILGALKDPLVNSTDQNTLAVNVGNGHTLAAILRNNQIIGLMEHHTRLLTPKKMENLLIDFADGKIDNDQVFKDHGHGLFYLSQPPTFNGIKRIVATGPNRNRLAETSLPIYFAAPGGDVMMTGPMGLIEAAKRKLKLPKESKFS